MPCLPDTLLAALRVHGTCISRGITFSMSADPAVAEECLTRLRRRIVALKVAAATGAPPSATEHAAALADGREYLQSQGIPPEAWGIFSVGYDGPLVFDINLVTELRKLGRGHKGVQAPTATTTAVAPILAARTKDTIDVPTAWQQLSSSVAALGRVEVTARPLAATPPPLQVAAVLHPAPPPVQALGPSPGYYGGKGTSYMVAYKAQSPVVVQDMPFSPSAAASSPDDPLPPPLLPQDHYSWMSSSSRVNVGREASQPVVVAAVATAAPVRLPFPGYVPANAAPAPAPQQYQRPPPAVPSPTFKELLASTYAAAAPSLLAHREVAVTPEEIEAALTPSEPVVSPCSPPPSSSSLSPLPTRVLFFASPPPVAAGVKGTEKEVVSPWEALAGGEVSFSLTPVAPLRTTAVVTPAPALAPAPAPAPAAHEHEESSNSGDEDALLPEVGPLDVTHGYLWGGATSTSDAWRRQLATCATSLAPGSADKQEPVEEEEEAGEDPVPFTSPASIAAARSSPLVASRLASAATSPAIAALPPSPPVLPAEHVQRGSIVPPAAGPGRTSRQPLSAASAASINAGSRRQGPASCAAATSRLPVTRRAQTAAAAPAQRASSKQARTAPAVAAITTRRHSTSRASSSAPDEEEEEEREVQQRAAAPSAAPRLAPPPPAAASHKSSAARQMQTTLIATVKAAPLPPPPPPPQPDPAAVAAAAAAARRLAQERAAAAARKLAEEKARAEAEKQERVKARFAARDARLAKFAARQAVVEALKEVTTGAMQRSPPAPRRTSPSHQHQHRTPQVQHSFCAGYDDESDEDTSFAAPALAPLPAPTTATTAAAVDLFPEGEGGAMASECPSTLHTAQRLSPSKQRERLQQLAAERLGRSGGRVPSPSASPQSQAQRPAMAVTAPVDPATLLEGPASDVASLPVAPRLSLLKAKAAGGGGGGDRSRAAGRTLAPAAAPAPSQPPVGPAPSLASVLETTALNSSIVDPDTLLDSLASLVVAAPPAGKGGEGTSSVGADRGKQGGGHTQPTLGDALRAVLTVPTSSAGEGGAGRRRRSLEGGKAPPALVAAARRPSLAGAGSRSVPAPEPLEDLLPGESFFLGGGEGEGFVFPAAEETAAVLGSGGGSRGGSRGFVPMFSGL